MDICNIIRLVIALFAVALGAVIGVLVVLQIITLIGCAIARRRNTNGS